jgi:nicotinamidase-related amidase
MAAAPFDVREARRMSLKNEWLIVIDMQRAFADSPSPWAAPGFYAALAQVERLLPAYRGRTILTRYVPPKVLAGAWIPYFAMFPSLLRPEDDPLWDLKLPADGGALVETRTTFGKWDAPMAALTGPGAPIAVCGVATECCVLSTILGAVDHGRFVRLVSDACAAGSPQGDAEALAILAGFAPMVSVAKTDEILSA